MSTSQGGGAYANNYKAASSGGCYTTAVYKAHSHKSSCYSSSTCYHRGQSIKHSWFDDGDGRYMCTSTCQNCGSSATVDTHHSKDYGKSDDALFSSPYTYSSLTCGKTPGVRYSSEGVEYYACSCGHSAGEIVKAEIIY